MSARSLADEVHHAIDRKIQSASMNHQIATVTRVSPLTLDPQDLSYILHEDDVELSAWVRAYHKTEGIKKNDNVILSRINDTWVVHDVLSGPDLKLTKAD